ncbi:MAG: alpha/beta fold hydrolase [Dysgonomonas sp.]
MAIIQVNNKKIHVLEMNREASQTIVMIHGMFTNMSVFYFNIAPELAKYFHVVLYDLQSHGMSERIDNGYNLEAMSEDLVALLNELDLTKVHLVGYSYGGLIALKTAMLHPKRIEKLTVIESPKPDEGDAPEILQKYGNEFLDQYLNNYAESTSLQPSKRQIEKNKKLYEYLFNHTSIKEDFDMDNDLFDIMSNNPIKMPTLLLYGSESDCSFAGDFLKNIIPDSYLLKGQGDHNLPVQKPQWVSDKLLEFMR